MHVRHATAADTDGVARVQDSATATLRLLYRPLPSRIQRYAERAPRLTRLVAIDGDDIVGTVEYELLGQRLHLINLGVLAQRRRGGVARHLIDALVQIATAAGANRLSLYTIRETGNVDVFARLGFTVVGEGPGLDYVSEQPLHEVYMERMLG